jgi:hypothetical protein
LRYWKIHRPKEWLTVLTLGEVHTGLLQHSTPAAVELAARLLALTSGVPVRRAQRPITYLVSPELVTGVDCQLATGTGGRVRGVGTLLSRAAITGGQVVQGSALVRVRPGSAGRRQPWSYYLAEPGVVETLTGADEEALVNGFLTGQPGADLLDLGAVAARAMDAVQTSAEIDHAPALKAARTRLRWALDRIGPRGPDVTFTVDGATTRTLRLRVPQADPMSLAALCEDLALHDWLLTTLVHQVSRARIGNASRSVVVDRLRPAVDHLLHLWMPAARVVPALRGVWASIEEHPGLTRQWQATVDRVRDQLTLAVIEAFQHSPLFQTVR